MRAILTCVFIFLFVGAAYAQSCQSLRGQLASAQAGKPNARVVASLNKRAQSFGCSRRARAGEHRQCASINAQLRQAKAGGVNRNRVRRLQRAIADHCGGARQRTAKRNDRGGVRRGEKGNRRNIFSAIFGRRDKDVEVARVEPRSNRRVERVNLDTKRKKARSGGQVQVLATGGANRVKGRSRVGNARTMCVRLCDGFYFPINNRSHSDNYYDELAMCVGRCPGADVSLYVHGNGQAVEQMRSVMTGESYVNLPTAFKYRTALSPGCGCANGTQIVRTPAADAEGGVDVASAATDRKTDAKPAAGSRWVPFRAVYDGTGEPLVISQTAYGTKFNNDRLYDGEKKDGAAILAQSREAARARALEQEAIPAVEFDPSTSTAREIGPQFFSRNVAAFAAEKDAPRRRNTSRSTLTAITVTPLPNEERTSPAPTPAAEVQPASSPLPSNEAAMVPTSSTGG